MRVDHEFVRDTGVEIPIALGGLVERDDLYVYDFANRKPVPQDRLHQLPVVFQHRGLPGVEAVRFRPAKAEAKAQHSALRRFVLCARIVGHIKPGIPIAPEGRVIR